MDVTFSIAVARVNSCNNTFSLLPLCRAQVMALGTVTSLVAQHKPRCPHLLQNNYMRIGSISTTIPYIEKLINGFLPTSWIVWLPNTCLYPNNMAETVVSRVWYDSVPLSFPSLAVRKVARAWYLFSSGHDVIRKWQNFAELTGCVSSFVQPTTHSTLGVFTIHFLLARYVL